MFNIKLPDITNNKLESAKERKAIMEYLYNLTQEIRNMKIDSGSLDSALLEKINTAVSEAARANNQIAALTVAKIIAGRIDVDNLFVKHLEGADGSFIGTVIITNPLNSDEQIIIGQNADEDFGGFITRDNGVNFIKWLGFEGLEGGAITPGSFDPLATPTFTYTGSYTAISDGLSGWRIKFLTSGTFTPDNDMTVDIFLLGGGGGGGAGGGGGGGRTVTQDSIALTGGVGYPVVVGAGGAYDANGVASTMSGYSASGGTKGGNADGGSGGSGGGGSGADGGDGGTNGSDGQSSDYGSGGSGLDVATGTREFHEAGGDLYAGAGGGSAAGPDSHYGGDGGAGGGGNGYGTNHSASSGQANKGGGGGGGDNETGGSGIVIIRNHRA